MQVFSDFYCNNMKLLIVLLLFTAQEVYTQQAGCRLTILRQLNDDFFGALRKVESEGNICKMGTDSDKLGPYQISEEYYNDAVESNEELKTGGSL